MILLHIVMLIKQCYGILSCDCPSGCASCLNQRIQNCPLKDGLIKPRFIRNTNGSPVYDQVGGSCYAYAACSAYVNTILRIYGSKPPPSFDKCVKIADYNHGNGGAPDKSITLLEDAFQYGIKVTTTTAIPTIKEIMTQSIIISFATSKEGWYHVANGSLLVKPPGEIDGWHASLLEGFDFQNNLYIVKNSWGGKDAKPRFDVDLKATHSFYFYKVYFTLDSISNKTTKNYEQKIEKCNQTLYNKSIKAAWMDKNTAIYNSNYVCECHPERNNNLNYLGYDIDQYIDLTLKNWGVNYNEFILTDFIGLLLIIFLGLFVISLIWKFLKFIYENLDGECIQNISVFIFFYLCYKFF